MMERLLDADILIELLRGKAVAKVWLKQLNEAPGVSGLAGLELIQGCHNRAEVRDVEQLLRDFNIIWPTKADMQRASQEFPAVYLRDGTGLLDMLTAQTAIGAGLSLCTFNVRHFRGITGLVVEVPYIR